MKRLSFLFICFFWTITSQARIITVDDYGYADFNTIQAAIDDAHDGDTILVADGTYRGNGNRDIDFKGKAITVRSENGPQNCIIDCQGLARGFYLHSGEDANSILAGFTITNGYADLGGGIYCDGSSPTLDNCRFSENQASEDGGGMLNFGSNPTLTNCIFTGNSAGAVGGGGMFNMFSGPTLVNCTFVGNSASHQGGGICNDLYSDPTLINCVFTANSAYSIEAGGGIWTYWHSNPRLINCTLTGNLGGGIRSCYPEGDITTLTNCILWGNSPEISGPDFEVTYSDVQGGWLGQGNINIDPCFVKPGFWYANNIWVEGDYHLLPDSPCIDAGTDAGVYTDIEGNVRPFDYPGVDNNGELPEFDMGAYEMLPWIKVPMKFTPQALNCNSKSKWVKAHFVLPAEFTVDDVDSNRPAKVEPLGIESHHMDVFVNEDGLVQVDAAFDRAAFCDAAGCGAIEITVVGLLTDGRYFYGTDTIRIIKNSFECLAFLSSHWLQINCGKPNWCNGFDVDRDSVVNFKDFVLMASHWEDYSD